jgi:hypothetical protein
MTPPPSSRLFPSSLRLSIMRSNESVPPLPFLKSQFLQLLYCIIFKGLPVSIGEGKGGTTEQKCRTLAFSHARDVTNAVSLHSLVLVLGAQESSSWRYPPVTFPPYICFCLSLLVVFLKSFTSSFQSKPPFILGL